jgi:hypothetical protein
MKKVLLLLLVAAGAYGVWRRVEEDREDRDLWAEVTDSLD